MANETTVQSPNFDDPTAPIAVSVGSPPNNTGAAPWEKDTPVTPEDLKAKPWLNDTPVKQTPGDSQPWLKDTPVEAPKPPDVTTSGGKRLDGRSVFEDLGVQKPTVAPSKSVAQPEENPFYSPEELEALGDISKPFREAPALVPANVVKFAMDATMPRGFKMAASALPSPVKDFGSGMEDSLAQTVSSLSTPENLAIAGIAGGGGKAAQAVIGSVFAGMAAKQYPEQFRQIMQSKSPKELGAANGGMIANLVQLFGGAAGLLHAAHGVITEGAAKGEIPAPAAKEATDAIEKASTQPPPLPNPELPKPVEPATATVVPNPEQEAVKPTESVVAPIAQPEAVVTKPTPVPAPAVEPLPESEGGDTSIKNAIVDAERVKRQIDARTPALKRSYGPLWEQVQKGFEADSSIGTKLVNDLKNQFRPLTDTEDAVLTHEQVTRQAAYDNAVEDVNNAKTDEDRITAQLKLAKARDDVFDIYDVGTKAGSANARGLAARRMMVQEDYTLSKMEARTRAAKGGERLTDAENAKVESQASRIKELEEKIAQQDAKNKDAQTKDYFDQLMKEISKDRKAATKRGENLTSFLDSQAEKARARIRSRGGRLFAGIDPVELADHAIIGASYIAKGAVTLADYSTRMVKDFGEKIKPFLSDLFEKSKQLHDANAKVYTKPEDSKPVTVNSVKVKAAANAAAGKPIDPQIVFDLARAHVNAGVDGMDNVMAAVRTDLEPIHPGITDREVRDAFSGYGKVTFPSKEEDLVKLREYRRLGQLVSAIEDAEKKQAPKKTGSQRDKPTQAIREKMKQLTASMKANGIETTSPEEQLASTNQSRTTALKNQIEDLDKRLQTGEKPVKGTPTPDSPEVERLKAERDAMKAQLAEMEKGPQKTPERIALERYKKAIQTRTTALNERVKAGNYNKLVRNKTKLDAEATKLRANYEREKLSFDQKIAEREEANKPTYQKALDQISGAANASALSGISTLGKLVAFSAAKLAEPIFTEPVGKVLSKTPGFRGIFGRSKFEGNTSVKSLAELYTKTFTKGIKEAWKQLRTGQSDIKSVYGKKTVRVPHWYDFFGNIHAAEKTPLLTGNYEMNIQKANEWAIKNGLDPNDEMMQGALRKEAFDYSNRAILQENNQFASWINNGLRMMESVNKETGRPSPVKSVLASVIRTFLTKSIVRVPANYVMQTLERTPAGLLTGVGKAIAANIRGVENLSEKESDTIARLMKVGLVGTAMFAWGAIDATKDPSKRIFGGYYVPRSKRDPNDVKFGAIRVGSTTYPHVLTHNAFTESAQIGETIMRVALSKLRKSDPDKLRITEGLLTSVMGLAEQAPVGNQMTRLVKAGDPTQSGGMVGDLFRGLVPQLLNNLAEWTDPEKDRKPTGIIQNIEAGIPGLRERVPTYEEAAQKKKNDASVYRITHPR